jgi:hypothetical protein
VATIVTANSRDLADTVRNFLWEYGHVSLRNHAGWTVAATSCRSESQAKRSRLLPHAVDTTASHVLVQPRTESGARIYARLFSGRT